MSDREGSGSDGSLEEEAYEVEEIREKMRGDDGEWLYYVKVSCQLTEALSDNFLLQWVGWESDTNTWEPREHLNDCREKLEEFERQWLKKQDRRRERRREEKERKRRERRERELKAAARFKVDSDSDGGGGGGGGAGTFEKKKEKKRVSSSESDSEEDRRSREKSRKNKDKRDRDRSGERRREEARRKEERKPKFFRDIKPEKVLGVTTDPGELYFYIKWEADKVEPSLVKAREAYQKIPQMCLKYYEQHLVWQKKEVAQAEPISEPVKDQPQSESTEEIASHNKEEEQRPDSTVTE